MVNATDKTTIVRKFSGIQCLFRSTIEGKRNYAVTRLKTFTEGKVYMLNNLYMNLKFSCF